MRKWAKISNDGAYRYELGRVWDATLPVLVFVMCNPSTADANIDDATIRRCIGFARSLGYGGIVVVNLNALRSTNPSALLTHADPTGPENDATILAVLKQYTPDHVICAWGAHKSVASRAPIVLKLIKDAGLVPCALRLTKDGHPSHPLRLPGSLRPVAM